MYIYAKDEATSSAEKEEDLVARHAAAMAKARAPPFTTHNNMYIIICTYTHIIFICIYTNIHTFICIYIYT
jgi:hypothetical protein